MLTAQGALVQALDLDQLPVLVEGRAVPGVGPYGHDLGRPRCSDILLDGDRQQDRLLRRRRRHRAHLGRADFDVDLIGGRVGIRGLRRCLDGSLAGRACLRGRSEQAESQPPTHDSGPTDCLPAAHIHLRVFQWTSETSSNHTITERRILDCFLIRGPVPALHPRPPFVTSAASLRSTSPFSCCPCCPPSNNASPPKSPSSPARWPPPSPSWTRARPYPSSPATARR